MIQHQRLCWGHGEKRQEEREHEGRGQRTAPAFYTGGDEAAAPGKPLGGRPGVFCEFPTILGGAEAFQAPLGALGKSRSLRRTGVGTPFSALCS